MKFVLLFVCVGVALVKGAYEGENCDHYGAEGVCRKLIDCPSAVEDLMRGKPPPPTCGFVNNNVIIVCCKTVSQSVLTTERSKTKTTTEYIPEEYDYERIGERTGDDGCAPIDLSITTKRTGQKAWDKCIEYQEKYVFPCETGMSLLGEPGRVNHCHHNADELIIAGTAAAKFEFTHMVLLGFELSPNNIDWKCGGALISEKFVLTAGHCISDSKGHKVSHAMVGILERSEESNMRKRYGIKRVIEHDSYRSPKRYHDIALLELDRLVKLDHTIVPACLHTGEPVDDSRASATGWGTVDPKRIKYSNILQKVILTKFTSRECAKAYEEYEGSYNLGEGYQEVTQICYGDRNRTQDTCQGDSGGPLQVKNKKIACMYTIVGVTSSGQSCGRAGIPAIYTRVSNYLSWIEDIVWPN